MTFFLFKNCTQTLALPLQKSTNLSETHSYSIALLLSTKHMQYIMIAYLNSKRSKNQSTVLDLFTSAHNHFINGAKGDRTPDLRTASATLSQLSYGPICNSQQLYFNQLRVRCQCIESKPFIGMKYGIGREFKLHFASESTPICSRILIKKSAY